MAPNMDYKIYICDGYELTEPNFTMSSVGIRLINFRKQVLSMFLIARFYLKCCALILLKMIFFHFSSFNRIYPAETPIFYQYSTSDQPEFVRKALARRPSFCFPEFAETVWLHSGTLLHCRSIIVIRQVGQLTVNFIRHYKFNLGAVGR